MVEYQAAADMPGVVQLHTTTALDREHALGLSITAAPAESFPGGPPQDVEDIAGPLELKILRRYDPSEQALVAILAGLLLEDDPFRAVDRIDDLLREQPKNPLAAVDPAVRAFVEHCAFAPIVGVEESLLKPKVLAGMVAAAASITVAIVTVAAAPVLVAAAVGVGVVVAVAVVGPPAVALGERLANAIMPK